MRSQEAVTFLNLLETWPSPEHMNSQFLPHRKNGLCYRNTTYLMRFRGINSRPYLQWEGKHSEILIATKHDTQSPTGLTQIRCVDSSI
jgi:hypothetical protein